eukprot:3067661-Heterocapsa_arctica.AAC.1
MPRKASLQRHAGYARLSRSLTMRSRRSPSSSVSFGMSPMNLHGQGLIKTGSKSPMASGVMKPEA